MAEFFMIVSDRADVTTSVHSRAYNAAGTSDFHVSISLSLFVRPAIVIRLIACVWQRAALRLIDVDFRYRLSSRCRCKPSGYGMRGRTTRQAPITDNQFRQRRLRAQTALIKGADAAFRVADTPGGPALLKQPRKSFRGRYDTRRFQIKRLARAFTHT